MDDRLGRLLLGAFVVGLAFSITLCELMLTALTLRLAYRVVTGRARTRGWPLALPLAAWIAVSVLTAVTSDQPLQGLVAAKGLLLITTFYVVLDALADAPAAGRFVRTLLALLAIVSVVGVLQVAFCPWIASAPPRLARMIGRCHRAHGFYSIYMTLAGVLSLVLLAALPGLFTGFGSRADRPTATRGFVWSVVPWLLNAAALALTYVRGAWLGFFSGLAVVLGLLRRGRVLLGAGVVVLVAAVLLLPGVLRRAESIADPNDPTARERVLMWRSGLAMVRDHPILGSGPGGVKREYPRYASADALQKHRGHLHNVPLQILVERGVLGLIAWCWVFVAFFYRAGHTLRALPAEASGARQLAVGAIAAIAGFLVGGLTEYNFGDSEVAMIAWAVMALPFVATERARSAAE